MRITQGQAIDAAIRQAQTRTTEIAKLQNQLSSGLRISRASDSPAEWGTLTAQKAMVNRMDTDLDNISTVQQRLNQSVTSLIEAGNMLVRARELALSGPQEFDRELLASEVDGLIDAVLSIANTTEGGLHLYSGTSSDKAAFEVTQTDDSGRPTEISYVGSRDASPVVVGSESTAGMLANGAEVFDQQSRGATTYLGSTGATAGLGTDSATGVGTLSVRQTGTTYSSGVVSPGASAADDTVIGAAGTHTLSIETHPTLGQVARLNGGNAVVVDAAATDAVLVGPEGERIHVDLSSVPPGLEEAIDVTGSGTVSVDGGQTEVAIDFSESQIVQHAGTGDVTVVDTSSVVQSGEDRIEYSGTNGVFGALIQLRDDLRYSDGISTPEMTQIMDARIEDITRAHDQVMQFVGEQSVELSNLETLESRTRELRLVTLESVTETESVDAAAVIVELQAQQNHLQFIYSSIANLTSTSLLDFIR